MTTPFEKYLQDADYAPYETAPLGALDGRVQLQIPQFMHSGPPTLAHGGGAEVLPLGTFNHTDSLAASWFANNNGFSPDEAYFSSSLRSYAPQQYILDQQSLYDLALQPQQQPQQQPLTFAPPPPPPQAAVTAHDDGATAYLDRGAAEPPPSPSPFGPSLVVYSASGFDVLSILARVATRPHPRVLLGPVDLTCAFVVVDVRRHDHPVVYCSPSFCRLTGYAAAEVLGRNCRFLQSPDGQVQRGEPRRYTSAEAVAYLRKHLVADKECQTRIVNYRRDGSAFVNLVTVIPVTGGSEGEGEVVYHVGFQVDLTEQQTPGGVWGMQRYSPPFCGGGKGGLLLGGSALGTTGGAKKAQIAQPAISKTLKTLLADAAFVRSIPISSTTTVTPLPSPSPSSISSSSSSTTAGDKGDGTDSNQWLNLMLLETCPDFLHVVSLKGSFLYVAPSVRRVLGYEPEEMVGGSLADLAHPEDVVPLMRELKESSSTGGGSGTLMDGQQQQQQSAPPLSIAPRTVDLLFRARTKAGEFVWVECRGRLFVEPGKGRKAIILSGRAREMPRLRCAIVDCGGREFWCMVAGCVFVVVGSRVKDVLGWNAGELVGRAVGSVVCGGIEEEEGKAVSRRRLWRADGVQVEGTVVLYRAKQLDGRPGIARWPIICQIKLDESVQGLSHRETDIFEELETSRGSSWQYELQQLRFANQRMQDELCILEAQAAAQHRCPQLRGLKRSWESMD